MKFSNNFIKSSDDMCSFDNYVSAPYFRKTFDIDFLPENAEITVCGLGFYELYINGENITKGPLAPYISNPDHICYYDSYDVSDKVKNGATTLFENFPHEDGREINSQNHHFLGDISSWFIQDVVGIKPNPNMTDISEFEVSPHFIKKLDFAKAHFTSGFGKLEVEWKRNAEEIDVKIIVPKGMHGRIKIENGYILKNSTTDKLIGGIYQFKILKTENSMEE